MSENNISRIVSEPDNIMDLEIMENHHQQQEEDHGGGGVTAGSSTEDAIMEDAMRLAEDAEREAPLAVIQPANASSSSLSTDSDNNNGGAVPRQEEPGIITRKASGPIRMDSDAGSERAANSSQNSSRDWGWFEHEDLTATNKTPKPVKKTLVPSTSSGSVHLIKGTQGMYNLFITTVKRKCTMPILTWSSRTIHSSCHCSQLCSGRVPFDTKVMEGDCWAAAASACRRARFLRENVGAEL